MNAEPNIEPLHHHLRDPAHEARRVALDPALLCEQAIFAIGPANENARPFTMIRSALLDHARSSGQRTFAVTSADPGNGKTHVAANLAGVLARVHPTVLVELDLRKPSLGARLGLPGDHPGVDDYLAGECHWLDTRMEIEGTDLAVHRVRAPRGDAAGLLAHAGLINALRRTGSGTNAPICIVDTPPAIVSDDLVFISRCVDGALLVAEEGRSSKHALREVARSLGSTPIVGSILNRSISRPSRQVDYGYYASDA